MSRSAFTTLCMFIFAGLLSLVTFWSKHKVEPQKVLVEKSFLIDSLQEELDECNIDNKLLIDYQLLLRARSLDNTN